jgi:integrase
MTKNTGISPPSRLRITKTVVDRLSCRPGQPRAVVFDTEIRGFHVEALASGRKIFRLKVSIAGRQSRETIGEYGPITCEEARRRALALRGKVFDGNDPRAERKASEEAAKRRMTLRDLALLWLKEGPAANPRKRESSWQTDRRKLELHILPILGAFAIDQIKKSDIEHAQQAIARGVTAADRKKGRKKRSIARGGAGVAASSILCLSACYSWAIDQNYVDHNPCARVKKRKPRLIERPMSFEDVARVFAEITRLEDDKRIRGEYADILRLLFYTGARKGEIERLQWDEVDFERRVATLIERSKTGETTGARRILLSPEAVDILRRRQRVGPYVFPSSRDPNKPCDGLHGAWEKVRNNLGLQDRRIHDIRHTFATLAAQNGATLEFVGHALGHRSTLTTARYTHLTQAPIQSMVDRLSSLYGPSTAPSETASSRDAAANRELNDQIGSDQDHTA